MVGEIGRISEGTGQRVDIQIPRQVGHGHGTIECLDLVLPLERSDLPATERLIQVYDVLRPAIQQVGPSAGKCEPAHQCSCQHRATNDAANSLPPANT